MRRAIGRGAAAAMAASLAANGTLAQTTRTINFNEKPGAVTVQGEGAEVTLQPKIDGESMLNLSVSVRVPGYQTIIVDAGGNPAWADNCGIR